MNEFQGNEPILTEQEVRDALATEGLASNGEFITIFTPLAFKKGNIFFEAFIDFVDPEEFPYESEDEVPENLVIVDTELHPLYIGEDLEAAIKIYLLTVNSDF